MSLSAFAAPTALPITRHIPLKSPRHAPSLALAAPSKGPSESPRPARGKRVPTFKKLQRRHRKGPAAFRQKREAEAKAAEEAAKAADAKKEHRKRFDRDGIPLSSLKVGQALRGVVQNVEPYGAFVDVGATRDGMVHVRDMAVEFVHTPHDVVRNGDAVCVWVKYVDAVKKVLGLTMLNPTLGLEGRMKLAEVVVGGRYHGIVERVTNYGAYIDIGAERMAFLHVSGMWGKQPRETLDYVRLGDRAWVHVVDVDEEKGHVRLLARGKGDRRLTKEGPLGQALVEKSLEREEVSIPELAIARPREADEDVEKEEEDEEEGMEEGKGERYDDEFDFANEDADEAITFEQLGEIAHMFTPDTEVVGMDIDGIPAGE